MARLSAGNADGAKEELAAVIAAGEGEMKKLRAKGTKDAFSQAEVQPYIRAAHALGCLAYDEERYADAVTDLERVHAVDDGSVGIEARLISAKALDEAGEAGRRRRHCWNRRPSWKAAPDAPIWAGAGALRGRREAPARKALDAALEANPHYGKTLLGRIRRRVDNIAGAQPGSLEEALLYAQTYGDVWTEAAKKFLEKTLDEKPAKAAPAEEGRRGGRRLARSGPLAPRSGGVGEG